MAARAQEGATVWRWPIRLALAEPGIDPEAYARNHPDAPSAWPRDDGLALRILTAPAPGAWLVVAWPDGHPEAAAATPLQIGCDAPAPPPEPGACPLELRLGNLTDTLWLGSDRDALFIAEDSAGAVWSGSFELRVLGAQPPVRILPGYSRGTVRLDGGYGEVRLRPTKLGTATLQWQAPYDGCEPQTWKVTVRDPAEIGIGAKARLWDTK